MSSRRNGDRSHDFRAFVLDEPAELLDDEKVVLDDQHALASFFPPPMGRRCALVHLSAMRSTFQCSWTFELYTTRSGICMWIACAHPCPIRLRRRP